MKDITNPCSPAQLRRLNIPGRTVQRGHVGRGKLGDNLQQRRVLVLHVLSVGVEQRLELRGHNVHSCLQLGQAVADVVHKQSIQRFGQVGRAVASGQGGVLALKEGSLVFDGLLDVFFVDDVLLAAVDDADNAEFDGYNSAAENASVPK